VAGFVGEDEAWVRACVRGGACSPEARVIFRVRKCRAARAALGLLATHGATGSGAESGSEGVEASLSPQVDLDATVALDAAAADVACESDRATRASW